MNNEPTNDNKETAPSNPAAIESAFADLEAADTTATAPAQTQEEDHRKAVNDGRLKKASEELRQMQEENARLKAQLEELTAKRTSVEELRKIAGNESLDDDSVKFVGGVADRLKEEVSKNVKAQLDAYRAASEAAVAESLKRKIGETQNAAAVELEKKYPGFFNRIKPGGDLNAAYKAFLSATDSYAGMQHAAVINRASRNGRSDTVVQVFEKFISENGLSGQYQIPTGGPRTAAASAGSSGTDAGGRKVYPSKDAIEQEIARIAGSYRKGLMDRKVYDERSAELEDALRSGRYVK